MHLFSEFNLPMQDVFLYAVVVPVIPFTLSTRIGVPEAKGMHNCVEAG